MKKIWSGIIRGLKWTLILYSILLAYELLVAFGLLLHAGIDGRSFRELLLSTSLLGGHGLHSFVTALETGIPAACLIFSCWEAFFSDTRRVWRIVFPGVIYGILEILLIAKGLDWNFRIMTVDAYMIYVLATPILCGSIQASICFLTRRTTRS